MLTKKISYIIEKLSSSAANYEDENKRTYLLEHDPKEKIMRVYQQDDDGDRGLLKDIEGEYMTVTNLHYNEKHPYWANLCFWRDIDSELLLPWHISSHQIPYSFPPNPNRIGGSKRGRNS